MSIEMNDRRTIKLRRAVAKGMRRWPQSGGIVLTGVKRWSESSLRGAAGLREEAEGADVVRGLPRRPQLPVSEAQVILPIARRTVFKPGLFRPFARLLVWFWSILGFVVGNLLDVVLRRASVERRAVRLRRMFEETGASFAKLGQQLSLRADLLPYAYCAELNKMLDRAKPFPTEQAIATIERNLGRPLGEVFAVFDPVPIGSASLACVYQARLKTGERVAVKVRRPNIARQLAADLRALDWLLIVAETLTLIKPGLTQNFRHDLRRMLLGELNFRMEARFTEMFRVQGKKDGGYVTAPRVFFDYCSDEVMVSELVSGIWMWELMAAVDRNDDEFLTRARTLRIEPKKVARTLMFAVNRELMEHSFFHADPHPANLVVLPNNRICFVDFGAVGRFSSQMRNAWREINFHMARGDVGRMVNAALQVLGAVPPIEVERFVKAAEEIYAEWLYAVTSTDAEWWERSSAQPWLRYINLTREFGVPVSLDTIQFFRATLLHDSVVTRLDRNVDYRKPWQRYARRSAKEARQRARKQIRKRLFGPTDQDYVAIELFTSTLTELFFRLQRNIDIPIVSFQNIVGKIAYIVSLVMRMGYAVVVVFGIAFIADFIAQRWFGRQITWSWVVETAATLGWLQIAFVLLALVLIRRIVLRLNQPDTKPSR